MDRFSFLNAIHPRELEDMYAKYLETPDLIDTSWRTFFQGHDFVIEFGHLIDGEETAHIQGDADVQKELKVVKLIDAYRQRGHLFTMTNPVRERRTYSPNLDIENFGLTNADLNLEFGAGEVVGLGKTTLKTIITHLKMVYCGSIGVEYTYLREPNALEWIQNRLNKDNNKPNYTKSQKQTIFKKLAEAVQFENFLHVKYVGQKRFSLEGGESFVPGLYALIERAAEVNVEEFVIGMAHRGRLNVLANIFDKSLRQMFNEFEGKDYEEEEFDGDVKYHMGSTAVKKALNGKEIKLNLAPNPSHLETVGPVVEGISRAKINNHYKGDQSKVLPIIVHGDAAVSGQGVVYEVVQMSQLDGYKTGGTIHIVINNQIGFTTNYTDSRSSTYCTDIAKTTLSPVLHVNADDTEAVVYAMEFAMDFRLAFNRDVFVDLLGYRKYGHNEGDEPRFTQPKLYKLIAKHANPKEIYLKQLLGEGSLTQAEADEMKKKHIDHLESEYAISKTMEKSMILSFMTDTWDKYTLETSIEKMFEDVDTSYDAEELVKLGKKLTTIPEGKKVIRKLERLLGDRAKMVEEDRIDWGMGEMLTYGTLLEEGYNFRMSGQDVERGTFSHRHAVMKVEDSEEEIFLLGNVAPEYRASVYNSHLSEYGVLGFDYGYAMASPETLTIWEAQFGDFGNGAQIMIDQYISAAEDKWKLSNGLVMLLPHGYEGQGAEHSSARMERFLQLAAKNNMQVMDCSTPANLFHALRQQMKRTFRKPLVIFTPKSLLRHPKCISTKKEFAEGQFQRTINRNNPKKAKRLVFCTGKIYYDLEQYRAQNGLEDSVALVTIEQLYPFPKTEVQEIIDQHKGAKVIWTQEEPKNMGAWGYLHRVWENLPDPIVPGESAAPAPGSSVRHNHQHTKLIERVFNEK